LRLHQSTQVGQVDVAALAGEQQAAQFILDLLDRPGQGWLRDVALFRRADEISGPRDCQEIANFM